MKRTLSMFAVTLLLVGFAYYAARGSKGSQADQNEHPISNKINNGDTPSNDNTSASKKPDRVQSAQQPKVDLVIALDTSGSMSGLINAARQKLWDIVNEVARAQPTPKLRVGLLTYGSGGTETDGYVIVQSDLTTDLDTINGKLFELSTSGGTEYVGRVVYRALNELSWDKDQGTLRQIYVAGNESADQDRKVTMAQALRLAGQKGVFVNAIYCGGDTDSDAVSWREVSRRGEGLYAAIDHNHGTVAIKTPYDSTLNALSAKLNNTYLGYGQRAASALANQARQDKNAQQAHISTGASRALAKASAVYRNEDWDLVDAKKTGKLKSIKKEMLPGSLKDLSNEKLTALIDEKEKERAKIRQEILSLSAKRTGYVQSEMKKQGKSDSRSFDRAVKQALREQAAKKKITLN